MSQYGYKLTTKSKQVVLDPETANFGIYVWQMPDRSIIADGEGNDRNILCIDSERGDLHKINLLANAVKDLGITEGKPLFVPGKRKVSQEEYQSQIDRMKNGLIPDPLDIGAYKDELRGKVNGR